MIDTIFKIFFSTLKNPKIIARIVRIQKLIFGRKR